MDVNKIYNVDCLDGMKELEDNSVDLIVTDPPYGYSFMGKDWDKAVPSVDIWKEALRVLKPGAFAFVMCAPRQDVSILQMSTMQQAGFRLDFSPIYWAYAGGFPKAMNISKMVDKRNGTTPNQSREFAEYIKKKRAKLNLGLKEVDDFVCDGSTNYSWFEGRSDGQRFPKEKEYKKIKEILRLDNRFDNFIGEAERRIIGKSTRCIGKSQLLKTSSSFNLNIKDNDLERTRNITESSTIQAKALDGSYGGFQPKPAVEVILIAMKPLSEKTYTAQALANEKGITWLDDCRMPYGARDEPIDFGNKTKNPQPNDWDKELTQKEWQPKSGRFPSNLLVSQDILDDGNITISKAGLRKNNNTPSILEKGFEGIGKEIYSNCDDSGGFSRYFNVDKWFKEAIKRLPKDVLKTYPFLIVPKASKSEKNRGCENLEEKNRSQNNKIMGESDSFKTGSGNERTTKFRNNHPTVKPIKLMSYLITLGSRQDDIVLDPFIGSGTTAIAARILSRKFIGFEKELGYYRIAEARIKPFMSQTKLGEGEFEQATNCMSEM